MKPPRAALEKGQPIFDLLEEAVCLLKAAPAALLIYQLACAPFVIALLFFWAEMSASAVASSKTSAGAIVLALLYILMKTGQSRFACALQDKLAPGSDPPWPRRRWLDCALTQAIWQPSGFLALPMAALFTVPFPAVYAFYQNLLLAGSGQRKWQDAGKHAWSLAKLWPKQGFLALLVLFLFGLVIYINGWVLILVIPGLIKTLLGFESVFTRGGYAFLNSTFLAATVAFAYLLLDPLFKAVYVLRCFYAESRHSGTDLQVQLKRAFAHAQVLIFITATAALLASPAQSAAEEEQVERAPSQTELIPAPELGDRIEQVLDRREYRWRLPRVETGPKEQKGFLSGMLEDFFNGLRNLIRDVFQWAAEMWDKFRRFLDDLFPQNSSGSKESGTGGGEWLSAARLSAIIVLAIVCVMVAVFVIRHLRKRGKAKAAASLYTGVIRAPNLEDADLLASELPEDEWLKLGQEMALRGERRLALRAYYMAVLVRLSTRELLTIARYKTNRDYARELLRRARGREELLASFGTLVGIFERIWYGEHPVDDSAWSIFEAKRAEIFQIQEEDAIHV